MNKFTRLFLAATLSVSALSASANYHFLEVGLTDGTSVTVALASDFVAAFSESEMEILSDGANVEIPRDKISTFKFLTNKEDGIDNIDADAQMPTIADGKIIFSNGCENLQVFSTDGRLVFTRANVTELPLADLPTGVSIVNANGISYKINKN